MARVQPLFARPVKRLAASSIDAGVVACCGWFAVDLVTQEWYPYAVLAWALPVTYFAYECVCLRTLNGGSLGRRLFDIQVVSAMESPGLAWWQIVARPATRILLYAVLVQYFNPSPAHRLDLAAIPFLIEAGLLFSPASLTLADLVARTRVVNTPPPQPHRAPAGPMYSATDAEFGYPPRRHR